MRVKYVTAQVVVLACMVALTSGAAAGPVLDEILNYMFYDQGTPVVGGPRTLKVDRPIPVSKDSPVGQTFVTGPETDRIARVRAWLAPDEQWQPGEGMELVLWDSPAKKVSLGRYTIWYEFRGFIHNKAEWEINARVKPSTTYYFEVGFVGVGDGAISMLGRIDGRDGYPSGQGYRAGKEDDFDLAFEIHSKRAPDPIGNLKRAFARFDLNRPDLAEVKAAVDANDFESAIARTVSYFEARQKPTAIIDPRDVVQFKPDFDTTTADWAMQNYFQSNEIGSGYAGPDINWRAAPHFDAKGHIAAADWDPNRFGPKGILSAGYLATGNEKYAKKANDLLIDWYIDNPPPGPSRIDGQPWDSVWASLQTGIRLGHGFAAYSRLRTSPFFTTDCRFQHILSMADHADALVEFGKDAGGNWAFTQNSSMFQFSLNFPEFTKAAQWLQVASDRIAASLDNDWLPDGVETESAPGYQRFSYKPLTEIFAIARERGVKTPFAEKLRGLLEKQAEYFMYMSMPDGRTPFLGDWGDSQERGSLVKDSTLYDRPDMLYVGTAGNEGKKPQELSKLYPYAGIVTMRSDWGDAGKPFEDGRYLMLHGVHYGAHGHTDLNGITLFAHGRELLTDPGSHVYGSPEHELLTQSVSHNLLTVDGKNQKRGKAEFHNWATTPTLDYLSSWVELPDAVGYTRDVFYVRAAEGALDYWVIRDMAEGAGTHSLEQRWHFDADKINVDKASLAARTGFDKDGNLAIVQVDPPRLQVEETTADTWRPRGVAKEPRKLPTVIYKTNTALPAAIDTVLLPYSGKQAPAVQVKQVEKSADGMESVFTIAQGKVVDLFVMRKESTAKSIASEKISFDGDRLFVRRVGGKLRLAMIANGASLTVDGKELVKLPKPVRWAVVSIDKGAVKVTTSSEETEKLLRVKS